MLECTYKVISCFVVVVVVVGGGGGGGGNDVGNSVDIPFVLSRVIN